MVDKEHLTLCTIPNAGVDVSPALLMLLGSMTSTLSGFFGVGALLTGGLMVLGVPALFSVGTGISVVMGTSIINTLKHRKIGNVDPKLGATLAVGGIPAVLGAARLISQLESWDVADPVIRLSYVVLLAGVGCFILYDNLITRHWTA